MQCAEQRSEGRLELGVLWDSGDWLLFRYFELNLNSNDEQPFGVGDGQRGGWGLAGSTGRLVDGYQILVPHFCF